MEDQIKENTDLIDVSDVVPDFEGETAPEEEREIERTPLPEMHTEEKSAGGYILASFKDRLAAFVIDGIILYGFYWFLLVIYRSLAIGEAAGPIPARGWHGLIFHCIFLLAAFFYFFILETVFFASPGKLVCRLSIRDTSGEHASVSGIFMRNLIRFIDLILFPIGIGVVILEKTGWHQRLGDLIGHTVVIKKLSHAPRRYSITLDMLASASGRLGAFILDAAVFAVFCFGYLLLLNPDEPLLSMLMIAAFPVFMVLYFFLLEGFSGSSVGKLVFGYTICHEDGTSIDLGSALIRTLFRPFDNNPIGFICILLSIRKQRPGDAASQTLVLKTSRQLKGILGAVAAILLVIVLLFAGTKNRNNFLSESFNVNFLPAIDFKTSRAFGPRFKQQILVIQQFAFAAETPEQKRKPAIFEPGEKVFLTFNVAGYEMKKDKAWIQEDLLVRYPDETIGLKLENVIDFYQTLASEEPIKLTNNISLPQNALPGRYTVTITIRDKNSGKQLKEQRFFYVTAGQGQKKESEGGTETPSESKPKEPETPPAGPRTVFPQAGMNMNKN
jgi:uncharacterized RDD family membrane protein YckC